jgi:hypothetical protein
VGVAVGDKQADLERDQFRYAFILETYEVNPEMWHELEGEILEVYRAAWSDWRVYHNHKPLSETVDEFAPKSVQELHGSMQAWLKKWNLRDSWTERFVIETLRTYSAGPFKVRQPSAPGYWLDESEPEPPNINAVLSGGHGFGLIAAVKSTQQAIKILEAHKIQLQAMAKKTGVKPPSKRKDSKPFRYLARYQVLKQSPEEIARLEARTFTEQRMSQAIKDAAEVIGLTRRGSKTG